MVDGKEKGSVGIAERDGADTVWWTAERIHHQLHQGTMQPSSGRSPEQAMALNQPPEDRLEDHVRRNETLEGWDTQPILHLQAIPPRRGNPLPNFYNRDGIWGALNDPPSLRPTGWSLRTPFEPDVDEGALVCRSPGRAVLRLEPDGLFTASGIANEEFLCWAINQGRRGEDLLLLNPITVAEWVYSFFMFVNEELKPFLAEQWIYRLATLRFETGNIGLFGGIPNRMYRQEGTKASSDKWIRSFPAREDAQGRETFGFGALSPGQESFLALDRLYGLFGLGNDVIPFRSDGELLITASILDNL